MDIFDNRYGDLSDTFVLNMAANLATELIPIFEQHHLTSIVQALVTIKTEAKLAQKELTVSGMGKARQTS